uniref:Uncharacterized protein n=1 Tax=uncultured Nitrospirae bacterium MY2-3C TaxID=798577 RepID=D9MNZ0_9BACT|nr:hypothetical protein LW2_0040 [uncultured Nitrospirae bacterium MY2-3C]
MVRLQIYCTALIYSLSLFTKDIENLSVFKHKASYKGVKGASSCPGGSPPPCRIGV